MIIGTVLKAGMVGVLAGGMILAPLAAPDPVARYVSGAVKADSIGNFFKKMNKPKKKGRNNNPDLGIKILQGIGIGVAAVGLAKGNAGAIIIGTALVAAPIVFREEINRQYGRDQRWAGCLNCNKKRVLVPPDRTVSQAEQNDILSRIEADVMDMQGALKALGYYNKGIDGDYGPGSRRAAAEFQRSLGDAPTGRLSAYQRAELFSQARERGFEPRSAIAATALMGVEDVPMTRSQPEVGKPVPVVAVAPAPVPTIREFRLAQSQLERFSAEVLTKGDLTEVESATLLPDGLIEIALRNGTPPKVIRGGVETVSIAPHDLSDLWVRVSMPDDDGTEPVALNTIDSFTSREEADDWRKAAEKQIALLAKLTERDVPVDEPIVVADAGPTPAPQVMPEAVPAKEAEPRDAPSPALAPAPVATAPSEAELQQAPQVVPVSAPAEAPDAAPQGAPAPVGADAMADADYSPSSEQCGESLYVSFNFPEEYSKINHFNIFTPKGAIMTDNGDGTGYFTGACVQGKYRYKYVIVNHDEKKKKWSSSVQEGSFVIASLAGQCEIDLNDPNRSATLHCY